jgi:hypothetical protein
VGTFFLVLLLVVVVVAVVVAVMAVTEGLLGVGELKGEGAGASDCPVDIVAVPTSLLLLLGVVATVLGLTNVVPGSCSSPEMMPPKLGLLLLVLVTLPNASSSAPAAGLEAPGALVVAICPALGL